ncbi:GTP-binding protein [Ereboglobus sp. PH5-10]|uniref:ribosome biogenesis GTP-binding protein YihA/YsxC n=1 Tax=Ereboglobus sp. PH5-10 TaxID=2940629 RepID=UPI002405E56D|nr:ribosome biogenesis GTP-binding protein YihA/YsxC [Ereboglobus sp. PH5-10]MDF9826180.1 GTP-binding protein [Ereboglobus sp. PH5-10]
MKIKSAEFLTSATTLRNCPRADWPEFAMIGRSNVGKSSLINMLTERRNLAKVSATPGKTRLLNFFTINNRWLLVDLPGYGYAKVAQEKRADFNEAVAGYIEGRETLRCVFVLIDSRIEPQRIDIDFIQWLGERDMPHALIFTKTDKQSPTATRANIDRFNQALSAWRAELPPTFLSSSQTKAGRGEILRFIEQTLAA